MRMPVGAEMNDHSFRTRMMVDAQPGEVFSAINDVRGWWSGAIEGQTDRVGAEFTYRYGDMHRSRQLVTELVPGKRVVWQVVEAELSFVNNRQEWTGTSIVFEIAEQGEQTEICFAHEGLVPGHECYGDCSNAWATLIHGNLRRLIATGEPQPDVLS